MCRPRRECRLFLIYHVSGRPAVSSLARNSFTLPLHYVDRLIYLSHADGRSIRPRYLETESMTWQHAPPPLS